MNANQAAFPVRKMCRVLGVSHSGFYDWLQRLPSQRAMDDAVLGERIRAIHAESDATYGMPRIRAELAEQGVRVGGKRIARLMRAAELRGVSKRRGFTVTTQRDDKQRPAPDLVKREFTAAGPNQLWVADMTDVPTWPGSGVMGAVSASASDPDRATKAVDSAVACPLLEGIDLSGARRPAGPRAGADCRQQGHLQAGREPVITRKAMNTIRRYAADDPHVIDGTACDESLGDPLRVTVIATGLSSARRMESRTPPLSVVQPTATQPMMRAGIDNLPILNQVAPKAPGAAPAGTDYAGLNTPSVWRSARSQAAAKVDALASNGMGEIEIPAFLRKQAD